MFEVIRDGGWEGTLRCECGELFSVDATTEENLILKDGVLVPKCPHCGREGK